MEKPVQEDSPTDEPTVYPNQEIEDEAEKPILSKKERSAMKLKRNKRVKDQQPEIDESEDTVTEPFDLSQLKVKKYNTRKATPSNW
ncbi:hypothetical protein GQR36_08995 [Enterococcus termitis]